LDVDGPKMSYIHESLLILWQAFIRVKQRAAGLNQNRSLRKNRFKMNQIIKYPRTQHIRGSRLQAGDEDLASGVSE